MRNYEFKLTPAYCLYNGIAVKNQNGAKICFLSENPEDKQLRERVSKAFRQYLEYVNRQEDCPLQGCPHDQKALQDQKARRRSGRPTPLVL